MKELFQRWLPSGPHVHRSKLALSEFYRSREDYHEMTSSPGKEDDPQVQLLKCLLAPDLEYLEVGCGGGAVCRRVAEVARVTGVDVSDIALDRAKSAEKGNDRVTYVKGSAPDLPIDDESVDGVYCFEVLEHLWDPVAAVREMVRVVRPGGFLLVSMPNRFSLDLYLEKSLRGRFTDLVMAAIRFSLDQCRRKSFVTFEPELSGDLYPDCDAVSSVIPRFFCREVEKMGVTTTFWDSAYMCAHRTPANTDLKFQRKMSCGFARHFGDHFLCMFRKRAQR